MLGGVGPSPSCDAGVWVVRCRTGGEGGTWGRSGLVEGWDLHFALTARMQANSDCLRFSNPAEATGGLEAAGSLRGILGGFWESSGGSGWGPGGPGEMLEGSWRSWRGSGR